MCFPSLFEGEQCFVCVCRGDRRERQLFVQYLGLVCKNVGVYSWGVGALECHMCGTIH